MGFRFYKSIRLMPGVRINLSKSGVSTSLGVPGATVNLGRRRRRATLGLPGSGLSYVRSWRRPGSPRASLETTSRWWIVALSVLGIVLYLFR